MCYSAHLLATLAPSVFPKSRMKPDHAGGSTLGVSVLPASIEPIVSVLFNGSDRHRHLMERRCGAKIRRSIIAHRRNNQDNRDRKSRSSVGNNGVILLKSGMADLTLDARSTPAPEVFRATGAIP
jgi:hypothetical protein